MRQQRITLQLNGGGSGDAPPSPQRVPYTPEVHRLKDALRGTLHAWGVTLVTTEGASVGVDDMCYLIALSLKRKGLNFPIKEEEVKDVH